MIRRPLILIACFALCGGFLTYASRRDVRLPRTPLGRFPDALGAWRGHEAPDFEAKILAVLGVDDHRNDVFIRDGRAVGLYVGYYASQREGDTMHSPMNCLPGAGWQPVQNGHILIPAAVAGGAAEVNRVVIQKGEQKQLVLYWYQGRGRVVASEYWSKVYLVLDSIRTGRSDAALVRIVSPIDSGEPSAVQAAEARAVEFAQALLPALGPYIPS